jgi:hypothetical protein|tara:strand:+ start:219 stop:839 length:621 start_codon:yes stop_codon:yes gene_type:complete
MALFIPTYFSPISQYKAILNSDTLIFEIEDNFQKQTYRNRCYIYGANGKQLLNIPVLQPKSGGKIKTKDILVEDSNWQKQHFKSLTSAYNHSPFFEFYKDDILIFFGKKHKYLLDITIDSFCLINDALEFSKKYSTSLKYNETDLNDCRHFANVKHTTDHFFKPYTQIFDDKHGFIENLSILDLLFMEGPNSFSLLEKEGFNYTLQ